MKLLLLVIGDYQLICELRIITCHVEWVLYVKYILQNQLSYRNGLAVNYYPSGLFQHDFLLFQMRLGLY